jgi:hypothetical protein
MRCSQLLHVPSVPSSLSCSRWWGSPTVTTLRSPSRTSRSALLSRSFLSWPEGSSFVGARRTLLASRAASRGEVASCRERPVSEVRRMHGDHTTVTFSWNPRNPVRGSTKGNTPVGKLERRHTCLQQARYTANRLHKARRSACALLRLVSALQRCPLCRFRHRERVLARCSG